MGTTQDNALDRLFGALGAGDVQAAGDCLTDDGRIWHSFDRIEHDRAAAMKGWDSFISYFPQRSFTDIRRQATPEGFVQQHVMTVSTADGTVKAWPICIVVRMEGGRIARLEEYMDRAGSFVPE